MNQGRFEEAEACWRKLLTFPEIQEHAQYRSQAHQLQLTALLLGNRPRDVVQTPLPQELASQATFLTLRLHAFVRLGAWRDAHESLKRLALQPRPQDESPLFPQELVQTLAGLPSLDASDRTRLQRAECLFTATSLAEFDQWADCLATIERLQAQGPIDTLEPLLLAAHALQRLGRPQEALERLRTAQRLHPKHPTLLNNLGYLLLENGGDLAEASALIATALQQDPNNPSILDSWGWALFKQKRLEEAEPILRRAAELQPLSPEILQHFGEVLLALGRQTEALEQWERALAFAFPQRSMLGKRAQQLRAALLQASPEPSEPPDAPDGPEEDPAEEMP